MARIRIRASVDAGLIEAARKARPGMADSALLDEVLGEFVYRLQQAEIDASYAIYEEIPLNTPDEWGDLESFLDALERQAGTADEE